MIIIAIQNGHSVHLTLDPVSGADILVETNLFNYYDTINRDYYGGSQGSPLVCLFCCLNGIT